MTKTDSEKDNPSMWSPLRHPAFRGLWIAVTISNIGTWMHDMGVGWLMANLTDSSLIIALVQTATTLPFFLLALPAGTLADIVNRRTYLLATISWMMLSVAALAALTLLGMTTPWVLLALTFSLGIGNAMMRPALSACIPSLIPRSELRRAITLNSMSLNVSRSVGPILAGFLILSAGPGFVFLVNTFTFIAIIIAIYRWPRSSEEDASTLPVERFMEGMRAGVRYVRYAPLLQAVLIKGSTFFIFSSASWALLPVISVQILKGGPTLYGLLIAYIGIGAVMATQVMAAIHKKFSRNAVVTAAGLIYAVALCGIGNTTNQVLLAIVLLLSGASWLALFSSIIVAGQLAVPDWVRARGLAMVMLTMMGSMSVGSAIWGVMADQIGIPNTTMFAGIGLAISLICIMKVRIGEDDHIDLTPSMHWPTPEFADDIRPDSGPVMVSIEYIIKEEDKAEFMRLSRELKKIRKRDGAFLWQIFNRAGTTDCFVEIYMVNSWLEHLRQHKRVTYADKEIQDKILALHSGDKLPRASHFIA